MDVVREQEARSMAGSAQTAKKRFMISGIQVLDSSSGYGTYLVSPVKMPSHFCTKVLPIPKVNASIDASIPGAMKEPGL